VAPSPALSGAPPVHMVWSLPVDNGAKEIFWVLVYCAAHSWLPCVWRAALGPGPLLLWLPCGAGRRCGDAAVLSPRRALLRSLLRIAEFCALGRLQTQRAVFLTAPTGLVARFPCFLPESTAPSILIAFRLSLKRNGNNVPAAIGVPPTRHAPNTATRGVHQ
jgi:hypothetical protein